MCVGDRWNTTHQSSINNFSKNNKLHILTDLLIDMKTRICIREIYLVIMKK